jgi:hypothetical protein
MSTAEEMEAGRSSAEKNRKFLESVLAWPDANGPGWINLHVNRENNDAGKRGGKPFVVGWPTGPRTHSSTRRARSTTAVFILTPGCGCRSKATVSRDFAHQRATRNPKNVTRVKAIWIDVDVKQRPADHPADMPWTDCETLDRSQAVNSPKHDNNEVRGVPAEQDGESEPSSRMAGAEHAEISPTVTTMADVPSAFAAQADADQHFAEITATAFPAAKGAYP